MRFFTSNTTKYDDISDGIIDDIQNFKIYPNKNIINENKIINNDKNIIQKEIKQKKIIQKKIKQTNIEINTPINNLYKKSNNEKNKNIKIIKSNKNNKKVKSIDAPWMTDKKRDLLSKLYIPELNKDNKFVFNFMLNKHFDIHFNKNKIKDNINYIKHNPFNYDDKLKQINKKQETHSIKTNNNKKLTQSQKNGRLKTYEKDINKEIELIGKIIKTRETLLNFDEIQINIIKNWFKICDNVYDECLRIYYIENEKFNIDYKKLKIIVFNNLFGTHEKGCPYDTLTDEVRVFCSNLKSCMTNLENGHIKKFELKKRKHEFSQSILIPKKSINNDGIFVGKLGKIKKFQKDADKIYTDSRLIYDKIKNKFYLNFSYYEDIEKKTNKNKDEYKSLDPGGNVFLAFYSPTRYGFIGKDKETEFQKHMKKIKKFQRILSTKKTHDVKKNRNNKEKKDKKENKGNKLRNHKKLKKKIIKCYRKMHNIVKELHHQTAHYLCSTSHKILIPEFGTRKIIQKMPNITNKKEKEIEKNVEMMEDIKIKNKISNEKIKMVDIEYKEIKKDLTIDELIEKMEIEKRHVEVENKKINNKYDEIMKTKWRIKRREQVHKIKYSDKTEKEKKREYKKIRQNMRNQIKKKYTIQMLSHYRFRQYLIHKGKEHDCEVIVGTEEYTSMTCGKCGKLSKNYKGRTKICTHCKHELNRDLVGARNYAIKNSENIIK